MTKKMMSFWSNAEEWAPTEASELLSEARLSRHLSLTYCLRGYRRIHPREEDEGQLVLAWVNLGALVESALKLLLAVYVLNYLEEGGIVRNGKVVSPVKLGLSDLHKFFSRNKILPQHDLHWIAEICDARNAIHIYADKNIWNWEKLRSELVAYANFLESLNNRLPYP